MYLNLIYTQPEPLSVPVLTVWFSRQNAHTAINKQRKCDMNLHNVLHTLADWRKRTCTRSLSSVSPVSSSTSRLLGKCLHLNERYNNKYFPQHSGLTHGCSPAWTSSIAFENNSIPHRCTLTSSFWGPNGISGCGACMCGCTHVCTPVWKRHSILLFRSLFKGCCRRERLRLLGGDGTDYT